MTVKQAICKLKRIKDQSSLVYLVVQSGGGVVGGPVGRVNVDRSVPGRVILATKEQQGRA